MTKATLLLAAAASIPLAASELPPTIPIGPISYDSVTPPPDNAGASSFESGAPLSAESPHSVSSLPPSFDTGSATASRGNGYINFNAYSTNYQVRGMGVTDKLSKHGCSSLSASYILPNRNLFGKGLQQRLSGLYGLVWDASCPLGDTPVWNINYNIGKELLPNLTAEAGYSLRRGGLEGFMVREHRPSAHRVAQDFNLSLNFNDHQKGFFGHALWGLGFQGLTGSYFDIVGGYRMTDLISSNNIGMDVEFSAGVSPSFGYWGGGVEGIDAWRLRADFLPYARLGTWGRDARYYIRPWVQWAWSGNNAKKIDRYTGYGPIDHNQLTIGLDVGLKF